MASYAVFHPPSSTFTIPFKTYKTFRIPNLHVYKPLRIISSASLDYSTSSISNKPPTSSKNSNWQWKYKENSVNIYYEAHEKEKDGSLKNKDILMIPTISDVSTVEEWRSVAKDIVGRDGVVCYRATILDWPGLGYSDRPKLDYTADVMEKFLVDFINSPDGPLSNSGE